MSELYGFLPHMTEDERTLLFQIPTFQKAMMITTISLSILWGSVMKLFLYHQISQEKWSERPINILTLIDQVIHQFFNTVIGIGMISKVSITSKLPRSDKKYIECKFTYCCNLFSIVVQQQVPAGIV